MQTTLPLTALVVILIGILVVVLIASALCLWAMYKDDDFEADVEAASFRYHVRVHSAPHQGCSRRTARRANLLLRTR